MDRREYYVGATKTAMMGKTLKLGIISNFETRFVEERQQEYGVFYRSYIRLVIKIVFRP
jgi:hypothetical protein